MRDFKVLRGFKVQSVTPISHSLRELRPPKQKDRMVKVCRMKRTLHIAMRARDQSVHAIEAYLSPRQPPRHIRSVGGNISESVAVSILRSNERSERNAIDQNVI
jgi:hypothetical protein